MLQCSICNKTYEARRASCLSWDLWNPDKYIGCIPLSSSLLRIKINVLTVKMFGHYLKSIFLNDYLLNNNVRVLHLQTSGERTFVEIQVHFEIDAGLSRKLYGSLRHNKAGIKRHDSSHEKWGTEMKKKVTIDFPVEAMQNHTRYIETSITDHLY